MKVEQIKKEVEIAFEPITLQITFESQEELDGMMCITNLHNDEIIKFIERNTDNSHLLCQPHYSVVKDMILSIYSNISKINNENM